MNHHAYIFHVTVYWALEDHKRIFIVKAPRGRVNQLIAHQIGVPILTLETLHKVEVRHLNENEVVVCQ